MLCPFSFGKDLPWCGPRAHRPGMADICLEAWLTGDGRNVHTKKEFSDDEFTLSTPGLLEVIKASKHFPAFPEALWPGLSPCIPPPTHECSKVSIWKDSHMDKKEVREDPGVPKSYIPHELLERHGMNWGIGF